MPPIVITPDTYPKVQLALSNPLQWNTAWETLYTTTPALVHPKHILNLTRLSREQQQRAKSTQPNYDAQDDRYSNILNYETTCEIQLRLGVKIVEAFTRDAFERRWVSAPILERGGHVLKALANAGAQARNLNMARAYSSDVLRLDYLSRDGEVVLRLLREVVPQDISVTPKEPHWIRCQEWDVESQRVERDAEMTEEEKGDLLEVLVLRTKLIYLVLEGIIDSFFGRPLRQVTVSKERDRRPKEAKVDELRKTKEEYRLLYGGAGQAKLREELAALEERKSRREVTCGNCERVQEEGERFMRCKKCWDSLQRNVTYCGKDCQTADWKSRHKGICGKPLSSLNSVLAATRPRQSPFQSPQTSQFPPPTNGFKRTPQLVMLIRLLDTEPEFDYILHVGLSDPAKISIPQGPVRELFRAARFKAFVEGDRESYTQMSHFLIWFVRARLDDVKRRWDLKNAVNVMKTEFAFPELRMEMRKCQDVQWRDESRRPPLVRSLEAEVWNEFIENQKPTRILWDRRLEDDKVILMPVGAYIPAQAI